MARYVRTKPAVIALNMAVMRNQVLAESFVLGNGGFSRLLLGPLHPAMQNDNSLKSGNVRLLHDWRSPHAWATLGKQPFPCTGYNGERNATYMPISAFVTTTCHFIKRQASSDLKHPGFFRRRGTWMCVFPPLTTGQPHDQVSIWCLKLDGKFYRSIPILRWYRTPFDEAGISTLVGLTLLCFKLFLECTTTALTHLI